MTKRERAEVDSVIDAIDYLDMEILRHDWGQYSRRDSTVELPLDVARLLLQCARRGMLKKQGRGGVALGHYDRLKRESVIAWGRSRKAKLRAEGKSGDEAEEKAAEEAREYAHERFGINLAVSTIRREMRRRSL